MVIYNAFKIAECLQLLNVLKSGLCVVLLKRISEYIFED